MKIQEFWIRASELELDIEYLNTFRFGWNFESNSSWATFLSSQARTSPRMLARARGQVSHENIKFEIEYSDTRSRFDLNISLSNTILETSFKVLFILFFPFHSSLNFTFKPFLLGLIYHYIYSISLHANYEVRNPSYVAFYSVLPFSHNNYLVRHYLFASQTKLFTHILISYTTHNKKYYK